MKFTEFRNSRDFMLDNKKIPMGEICAHRSEAKIRYFNNTMFAHCFMMKRDHGSFIFMPLIFIISAKRRVLISV